MSARLYMLVEGQTERRFCDNLLRDHLARHGVSIQNIQLPGGRGGVSSYGEIERDLHRMMTNDEGDDAWFTTMFDLYEFPEGVPGWEEHRGESDPHDQAEGLESAWREAVERREFVPYLQVHEFEALVLTDPISLELRYPEHGEALASLSEMQRTFDTPEHVDHDEPPSARITSELPEYQKPLAGVEATEGIGLERLREACPHFDDWITRLEELGSDG